MKVKRKIEAELDESFKLFVQEALKDFKGDVRKDIIKTSKEFNQRTFGNKIVKVRKTVTDYKENEVYELTVDGSIDKYIINYNFKKQKTGFILTYNEKFESKSFLRFVNHVFVGIAFRFRNKKRAKRNLIQLRNLFTEQTS